MTYNNKKTKELNQFQKNNIEERKLFDFFKELDKLTEKKKNFSRIFSQQIETLVQKFDERGIMFYSIQIEMPFLLKEPNMWEMVHQDVEEFINYIGSHVELAEFSYFAIEMKGRKPIWQGIETVGGEMFPCINGIIGVRSLLGKNKMLFCELKDIFLISHYDIKFESLFNYSDIIKYWNFVIKQKNFKFHRFVNYSNFYPMVYGAIADEELKFEGRFAFGQENHFISDTMNISGVNKKTPTNKELILLFLNLFMGHKKMKIYNNHIYIYLKKTKFSWQLVCSLDEIKKDFEKIFDSLKVLYPQQLINFNVMDLLLSDLNSVFSKIKKNNNLMSAIDKFDNVVEFKDGLFFLENSNFLSFSNSNFNEFKEYKTTFYVDSSFFELNSSEYWLKTFNFSPILSQSKSNYNLFDVY